MQTLFDITGRMPGLDPDAVTVDQARHIVDSIVAPLAEVETVPIVDALDRILAFDVISPIDVPAHDNSAMDGYAFCGSAMTPDAALKFELAGAVLAGAAPGAPLAAGGCVRIMTGAPMPPGADTVAPQELTGIEANGAISIPAGAVKRGDNVRLRGEDLRCGAVALRCGARLRPAHIGLLASLGIGTVTVRRRLRVALFSTGDELRSIGQPLEPGCIYDSNRYTLLGMLARLGCEVQDAGPVRDDPAALEAALRAACESADVINTSGGASSGDADYTRQAIAQLGEVAFWKMAMRPGRPLAFGSIGSNGKRAWLFGLPGNPVAAMVAFYCIAREGLLKIMGAEAAPLPLLRVASRSAIRKKPGRAEYQRGIVSRGENGNQQVDVTGSQGSGILRSMAEANCLIVLGPEQGNVEPGQPVEVLLFEGLV